jgi:hypothetical protein
VPRWALRSNPPARANCSRSQTASSTETGAFQACTEIRASGHRNGQLDGFCLFIHVTNTAGKSADSCLICTYYKHRERAFLPPGLVTGARSLAERAISKKTRSTVTVITAQSGCEVTIRSWVGKLQGTYARAAAGQWVSREQCPLPRAIASCGPMVVENVAYGSRKEALREISAGRRSSR